MWTSLKKYIFIFLISILAISTISAAAGAQEKPQEETRKVTLTWKSVPGAVKYIVEIRNRWGKEIIKTGSWNNRIKVALKPGRYLMRVTGQNKFKKNHGRSNWRAVVVKSFPAPVIEKLFPDIFKEYGGEVEASLSGKNFRKGISIYLGINGKDVPVKDMQLVSPEKITFKINPGSLSPGQYTIIAVDRSGKRHQKEKVFLVEKKLEPDGVIVAAKDEIIRKKEPQAFDISPGKIYTTSGKIEFSISGKNLENVRGVRLRSPGSHVLAESLKSNKNSVNFTADSDAMSPGLYSVEVDSAQGAVENKLNVTVGDPSRGLAALGGLNVALGYNFAVVLPQWNEAYRFSPAGALLYCGYDFSGFGLPGFLSFLQYFGMEYQFTWNMFTSYEALNRVDSKLNIFTNEIGLFAFINLRRDMRIYLRFRGGFTGSLLKYENLLGEHTEKSFDFDWQTGLAYRYTLSHFYFMEIGSYFNWIHYSSERMMNVNFALMFGLRL